ncbi:MAG: S-layer homology domain-containing protein [Lachnospiraceae bacterium]|nr:S-layer homology domain-containing protein [Lachnospiraceae bacterium]
MINQYADGAKVSSWAAEALNWAVSQGIMSGKGSGGALSSYRLDPQGSATRAECASMMMKLLNK